MKLPTWFALAVALQVCAEMVAGIPPPVMPRGFPVERLSYDDLDRFLTRAVIFNDRERVKFLLDNGACIHAYNDRLFQYALDADMLRLILSRGGDPRVHGLEWLRSAINANRLDLMEIYLEAGVRDDVNSTLLHEMVASLQQAVRRRDIGEFEKLKRVIKALGAILPNYYYHELILVDNALHNTHISSK